MGSQLNSALEKLMNEMLQFDARIPKEKVVPSATRETIRAYLDSHYHLEAPYPLDELFSDVDSMMKRWSVHPTHPRHFGLFVPSMVPASVIADTLTALYNPQAGAYWYSPVACEIERFTLDYFLKKLDFDPTRSMATFTTGGSEANLTAVLAALTNRFPNYGENGLFQLGHQPIFYVSDQAHDSFVKIAHHTGLGRQAVRRVKTDSWRRMDVDDLLARIASDRKLGLLPFLVAGTAGTTGVGAVDPLPALATVAKTEGLWLHVDAAWGGVALLSPQWRGLLQGIESADSVTIDAHKILPVPTGAGMFFTRHPEAVSASFRVNTSYVPQSVSGTIDLYQHSIQWSRRFIGLKVFMTLANLGQTAVASMIEHQFAMGKLLRERLTKTGWSLVNDSWLPLVCFTHPVLERRRGSSGELVQRLLARGDIWISELRIAEEQHVLRACITSYKTERQDIDFLVSELNRELNEFKVEGVE